MLQARSKLYLSEINVFSKSTLSTQRIAEHVRSRAGCRQRQRTIELSTAAGLLCLAWPCNRIRQLQQNGSESFRTTSRTLVLDESPKTAATSWGLIPQRAACAVLTWYYSMQVSDPPALTAW